MPSIDPGARFPSDPALPPAEAEGMCCSILKFGCMCDSAQDGQC